MKHNNITIIGCGTLGSAVAYSLALRSLDSDINKLYLVDDDVLEIKNLPYLFMVDHLHQNIHKPKVMILKSILNDINKDLEIVPRYCEFPTESYTESDKEEFDKSLWIDCRDNTSTDGCNIKLNVDGFWGSLRIEPAHVEEIKESRYTIKNSRYFSMILANICVRFIMGDLELDKYSYIIDLRKEKFYELQ